MSEFCEVLKAIRAESGLSQKDFASKIGMKPAAYNMIESGKNQPSYSLIRAVVSAFNLNPNRLFNISSDNDKATYTNFKETSEAEFLNGVHDRIRKINYLYQKLIDVRILLFQELRIKGQFSTEAETDLLDKLVRPATKYDGGETTLTYPYESLDTKSKIEYLGKLDGCINLFTSTFFECFEQLYKGIRIPISKDLRASFFLDREKLTDNWKYSYYIKSM
jgi:transcriptional regulator with XRE-family HTH domain